MTKVANAWVPTATWPEATPSIHEENIISISIGNTHISWAIHEGIKNHMTPTLFWRTPHLEPNEMTGDPSEVLATHIPDKAHALLFGSRSADATKKSAIRASALRRVSVLSIYIVSTNNEQLEHFVKLWSGVPSRMYLMQGDDFFTKEEGRYEGMGVDRLSNLRAAGDFHGFPALVFDGGTAATYTAADENGNVLGGGIGPGVQAKLRSLSDYAAALPHIKYDELIKEIAALTDEDGNPTKTLPVFARTTRQNIITRLCREVACEGHAVIQHFLAVVGPAHPAEAEGGPIRNNTRTVIVTGGDADLIARLLAPDYSKLLRMEPDKEVPSEPPYNVKKMKQMVHYGIQAVLKRKMEIAKNDPFRELENLLIGQRLAKRFQMRDEDGDPIFRGTITGVHRDNGKYPYVVRYDDGDGEDMSAVHLHEALELYIKVGEKPQDTMQLLQGVSKPPTGQKIDLAKTAVNTLATENDMVKAAIEKKNKKETPILSAEATRPTEPAVSPPSLKRKTADEEPVARKKAKKGLTKPKEDYNGDRIAKIFHPETTVYFGTIKEYWFNDEEGKDYWDVTYDDGDMETLEEHELVIVLNLYKKHKAKDTGAKS